MTLRPAVLALCLVPHLAFALSQDKHYQLTTDACVRAGFAASTCREFGIASHNTDAFEWDDLSAHAQIAQGQSVCQSATMTLRRLHMLGGATRGALIAQDASATAADAITEAKRVVRDFGRALHTVQDNCAHHGMPNPQHAWFSVQDLCNGTESSPDLAPEAETCAIAETQAAFAGLLEALASLGMDPGELYQTDAINRTAKMWPTRGGLCEFVSSPNDWHGDDEGWDNAYMNPACRSALGGGLLGTGAEPDACAVAPETLALKDPRPRVDTREKLTCQAVDAVCQGDPHKRDEVPPWESDLARALSAACAVGSPKAAAGAWPLLLVFGAVALRRRRP